MVADGEEFKGAGLARIEIVVVEVGPVAANHYSIHVIVSGYGGI